MSSSLLSVLQVPAWNTWGGCCGTLQQVVNYSGSSDLQRLRQSSGQPGIIPSQLLKLNCGSKNPRKARLNLLSSASGQGSSEPVQNHGGPSQEEKAPAQISCVPFWGRAWDGEREPNQTPLPKSHSPKCFPWSLGDTWPSSTSLSLTFPSPELHSILLLILKSGEPPQPRTTAQASTQF